MAHVLQAGGPINEQNHFFGLAQAAPDGLLSQRGAKVPQRLWRPDKLITFGQLN
jgi:hypothetical protein